MNHVLRRWFMHLRYEHAEVTLAALRVEIAFAERWLIKAKAHAETRQLEVERMQRDLEVSDVLLALWRRER